MVASVLFPIHAPRDRTASPSLAICICGSRGSLSHWFIFLVAITFALYSLVSIGMISGFFNVELCT